MSDILELKNKSFVGKRFDIQKIKRIEGQKYRKHQYCVEIHEYRNFRYSDSVEQIIKSKQNHIRSQDSVRLAINIFIGKQLQSENQRKENQKNMKVFRKGSHHN